ncbi:hypothetical protein Trydic_g15881 [Trypoxylus dichotomus]
MCCTNYLDAFSLFKTLTQYEQAANHLLLMIAIAGTITRPVYFFARRKRHKQIFLDLEKLDVLLNREERFCYVINYRFLKTLTRMMITNVSFTVAFSTFEMSNPTVAGYFIFLMSFNGGSVNDFLNHDIGVKIYEQIKLINENIRTSASDGTIKIVVDAIRCRERLVKLAMEFNDVYTLPLLIILLLHGTLSVWILHSAFLMVILKKPYYEYMVLLIMMRIVLTFSYATMTFGTLDSIQKEVWKRYNFYLNH